MKQHTILSIILVFVCQCSSLKLFLGLSPWCNISIIYNFYEWCHILKKSFEWKWVPFRFFFFFFLSSYISSENSLLTHSVPPKVIWNLVFNFLASWETSFAMEGRWGGGCDWAGWWMTVHKVLCCTAVPSCGNML